MKLSLMPPCAFAPAAAPPATPYFANNELPYM
jgi:hypothetical protein